MPNDRAGRPVVVDHFLSSASWSGPTGCSLVDATVGVVEDISAVYLNPAGRSDMSRSHAVAACRPWLDGIQTFFLSTGFHVPVLGVFAVSAFGVDYGEMGVTAAEGQAGKGEILSVKDYAFAFSYGRKLAQGFGFGASAKYVTSRIRQEPPRHGPQCREEGPERLQVPFGSCGFTVSKSFYCFFPGNLVW
jgi:hypothetical protein